MNSSSDNPFQSPGIVEEIPNTTLVDDEPAHPISVLVFVSWCLFMLIAMAHFGVCWVLQDVINGILFCITAVVGFILIIPTRGTMALATLYAFAVSISCATQAVIFEKGYQTAFLLGFVLAYAIIAVLLGYIGYQERLKTHG
ncbi:hypothetical protein Pan97_00230 [Bremerella volcania]|uniref:Uncharacterized protein n=1 Tax=Bremerella volcania TaxID=2527984 RepID=A0A518C1G0_9BACT|nr:hypothetical protein [Bremerella volcania]QDU73056.1 hypothetical protein Pan97_00230 [Bremerella volcania]